MPYPQRFAITLSLLLAFAAFIPSTTLADGVTLNYAVGTAAATCSNTTGAAAVSNQASTTAYTTTTSCDLNSILKGSSFQSVANSVTSLGYSPSTDVTASVSSNTTSTYTANALVTSLATYYATVKLDYGSAPDADEYGIPIKMTWYGESIVSGDGYATVQAALDGLSYNTPGQISYRFAPGEGISVAIQATCFVEASKSQYSQCQANADPTFTFDQTTFNADMAAQGLPTFNLADYYSFEFSPNLVPVSTTPEPSTLWLLAAGILGLAGIAAKKTNS